MPRALPFGRLENRHLRAVETCRPRRWHRRRVLEDAVGRSQDPVLDDAEHAPSAVCVVGRHLALPVGQPGPAIRCSQMESRGTSSVLAYVMDPPPTAQPCRIITWRNGCDIEEAAQREARPPDPAPEHPVGARQVFRRPAAAHLHHRHPIALLGQAMRRHAAAEAGADHDEIEVKSDAGTRAPCHFTADEAGHPAMRTGSPQSGSPAGGLGELQRPA